jgi:hypothetical protein
MTNRQRGVVVTHVDNLGQIADCLRLGGYDTIKVVTRWGIDGGWDPHMRQLLLMAPNVIVRCVAGDPSYDGHNPDYQLPDANRVRDELAPWYAIRPDIMFEIGNEPNIDDHPSNDFIYSYRAILNTTIDVCRSAFPQAKLISPGLIVGANKDFERFNQIAGDVFRRCDLIGLHFYEDYAFAKAQQRSTTNQLREAIRVARCFYSDKRWYVTEYGINNCATMSMGEKGRRYAGMAYYGESDPVLPANVVGLTYYHLNMKHDFQQEYHIFPDGDSAFDNLLRVSAPREQVSTGHPALTPLPYIVIDTCSASPTDNFASVRQAPRADAQEAGRLDPGTPVLIDAVEDGWAHLAQANPFRDLGFVATNLLRKAA